MGTGEKEDKEEETKEDWAFGASPGKLPSERDADGQQWSSGVAVLCVVHDYLQIFSVAGRKGRWG